jgi:hypothetical protein
MCIGTQKSARKPGTVPVNPGGGLVGFGHPVGATGVKQAAEIYRQMKGMCGDYQIQRELHTGLTANIGGDDRTVVCALQNGVEQVERVGPLCPLSEVVPAVVWFSAEPHPDGWVRLFNEAGYTGDYYWTIID